MGEPKKSPVPPADRLVPTAPRIKRREVWVPLPDEYEGFEFKLWVNAPTRLWNTILDANSTGVEIRVALLTIIIEHNGWLDFEGKPYPPADEPEFWDDIPTELAACIIAASQAETRNLPNSIASRRRRSRRG